MCQSAAGAPLAESTSSRNGLVGRRLDRRVAERERAEPPGERDLALVVERLVAEEHHLVLEQRPPDAGNGLGVEIPGDVDARQLGSDRPGERRDLQPASWSACVRSACLDWSGFSGRAQLPRSIPRRASPPKPAIDQHHTRRCDVQQQAAREVRQSGRQTRSRRRGWRRSARGARAAPAAATASRTRRRPRSHRRPRTTCIANATYVAHARPVEQVPHRGHGEAARRTSVNAAPRTDPSATRNPMNKPDAGSRVQQRGSRRARMEHVRDRGTRARHRPSR